MLPPSGRIPEYRYVRQIANSLDRRDCAAARTDPRRHGRLALFHPFPRRARRTAIHRVLHRQHLQPQHAARLCARGKQFFDWKEAQRFGLEDIEPVTVAAYIEQLGAEMAKPSIKQDLAAIRQLFDYLVTGGTLPSKPAGSLRGPKYVVKRGKTPVSDPRPG
jgi:hypothetical protein